jgi:pimeloyl-ACP methyl ester carboxylesterase
MSMRPGQLQASAQESAMLIPAAAALRRHYRTLDVPAVLIAGAKDRYVSTAWHSSRLHEQVERSWLRVVEGTGHMVHHVATGQVAAAIEQAAGLAWDRALLERRPAGLKAGEEPRAAEAPVVVACAGQAVA